MSIKLNLEFQQLGQMQQHHDDDEGDDEEMGVAETYADYWPAKLKIGRKHPDAVVETASLSSVEPTNVTYKLAIPMETIDTGLLSALQLESITYASQAHEQLLPDGSRAGFLIGKLHLFISKFSNNLQKFRKFPNLSTTNIEKKKNSR